MTEAADIDVTVRSLSDGRMLVDKLVKLPGLRHQRNLAALSQEDLGKLAGVQRFTITRLENGGEATPRTVRKLADALECEPRQLIEAPPS